MPRHRGVPALLVAVSVATAGCTTVVDGTAAPADPPVTDVAPEDFPVGLAGDGEVDRLARNALADTVDYWTATYPEVYGGPFEPLAGGYWSVDPRTAGDADLPSGFCADVDDVGRASALYCSRADAMAYNVESLERSVAEIGPLVVGSTMAHEVGHAVQHRAGTADTGSSLVLETQAECFAGAWSSWAADGEARHTRVRESELDVYLRGYRFLADPVGTDPAAPDAHGSAFDQIAAFQLGWAEGAAACRDEFDGDRVYTGGEFTSEEERRTGGDVPLAEAVSTAEELLTAFWTAVTTGELPGGGRLQGPVELPAVEDGDTWPPCPGRAPEVRLTWCEGEVLADETTVLAPAAREYGDFAVPALLAVPYALAVRDQRRLATDGVRAVAAAACTAGWLSATVLAGGLPGADVTLSPGDVDEAALALLGAADDPLTLGSSGISGYALVDAFRRGFEGGGPACAS